jgi:hypothetical protein
MRSSWPSATRRMSSCSKFAGAVALALALAAGHPARAAAQASTDSLVEQKPTKLFSSDSVFSITIASDIKKFMSTRDSTAPWLSGKMIVGTDTLKIGLRPRGHYRRKNSICKFPPVSVKFGKDVKGTIFAKQKKLKLVTTCSPGRAEYEAYIPAEYMLYRVYNLVTPFSFRARYVHVTYVDTAHADRAPIVTNGFFIEDQNDMAGRNAGVPIVGKNAGREDFDPGVLGLMSMFEFLIANTDWSFQVEHNIRFVRTNAFGIVFPVAYDFDFSGTVYTSYAVPDYSIPISTVRDRIWMSYCFSAKELAPAVARFNEQRPAITALYTNNPLLTPKVQQETLKYFDEFYKIVDDPQLLTRAIEHHCYGGNPG